MGLTIEQREILNAAIDKCVMLREYHSTIRRLNDSIKRRLDNLLMMVNDDDLWSVDPKTNHTRSRLNRELDALRGLI